MSLTFTRQTALESIITTTVSAALADCVVKAVAKSSLMVYDGTVHAPTMFIIGADGTSVEFVSEAADTYMSEYAYSNDGTVLYENDSTEGVVRSYLRTINCSTYVYSGHSYSIAGDYPVVVGDTLYLSDTGYNAIPLLSSGAFGTHATIARIGSVYSGFQRFLYTDGVDIWAMAATEGGYIVAKSDTRGSYGYVALDDSYDSSSHSEFLTTSASVWGSDIVTAATLHDSMEEFGSEYDGIYLIDIGSEISGTLYVETILHQVVSGEVSEFVTGATLGEVYGNGGFFLSILDGNQIWTSESMECVLAECSCFWSNNVGQIESICSM